MASIKTLAELYAYFETGDKPTQAQFEDLIYTIMDGLASKPKKYVALLSQSGTDAPVATVLLNTLGVTPSWSYGDVGQYLLTTGSSLFLEAKTVLSIQSMYTTDVLDKTFIYRNSDTVIAVDTANDTTLTNGILSGTLIEITVYP